MVFHNAKGVAFGTHGERHLDDLSPGSKHVDREPVASLRLLDHLHHSEVR